MKGLFPANKKKKNRLPQTVPFYTRVTAIALPAAALTQKERGKHETTEYAARGEGQHKCPTWTSVRGN